MIDVCHTCGGLRKEEAERHLTIRRYPYESYQEEWWLIAVGVLIAIVAAVVILLSSA
jgi:hypothetical protein